MSNDFSQDEIRQRFDRLRLILAETELPAENGSKRKCDPREFILLFEDKRGLHFKHYITQNCFLIPLGRDEIILLDNSYSYDESS